MQPVPAGRCACGAAVQAGALANFDPVRQRVTACPACVPPVTLTRATSPPSGYQWIDLPAWAPDGATIAAAGAPDRGFAEIVVFGDPDGDPEHRCYHQGCGAAHVLARRLVRAADVPTTNQEPE